MVYIGKEANNIDEQALGVTRSQVFVDEKSVYDFILNLIPETEREIGIKYRSELSYLKKNAWEGDLNFKTKEMRKIFNNLSC